MADGPLSLATIGVDILLEIVQHQLTPHDLLSLRTVRAFLFPSSGGGGWDGKLLTLAGFVCLGIDLPRSLRFHQPQSTMDRRSKASRSTASPPYLSIPQTLDSLITRTHGGGD